MDTTPGGRTRMMMMTARRRHFIQITQGGSGDKYLCVAIRSVVPVCSEHDNKIP